MVGLVPTIESSGWDKSCAERLLDQLLITYIPHNDLAFSLLLIDWSSTLAVDGGIDGEQFENGLTDVWQGIVEDA